VAISGLGRRPKAPLAFPNDRGQAASRRPLLAFLRRALDVWFRGTAELEVCPASTEHDANGPISEEECASQRDHLLHWVSTTD